MTLLEALKEIRFRACTGALKRHKYGICIRLSEYGYTCKSVCHLFGSWSYFCGDYDFPIGGEVEYYGGGLWRGRGLELRISLLNHLINELENI